MHFLSEKRLFDDRTEVPVLFRYKVLDSKITICVATAEPQQDCDAHDCRALKPKKLQSIIGFPRLRGPSWRLKNGMRNRYEKFVAGCKSRIPSDRRGYNRVLNLEKFVRRAICIFLLLLFPLHSFAVQGGWLTPGHMFDVAHEIEHVEGTSHHHNDDGAVHYDESGESGKHSSEHSAGQQAASLPPFPVLSLPVIVPMSAAITWPPQYLPDPIPERPQRPPTSPG